MDDVPYLMRGITAVPTDSSVLVSSSKYLNDPALRDWVATHMLRRSGQDRPSPSDSMTLVGILGRLQDKAEIEAMFTRERRKNPALDRWFEEKFISTYSRDDLGRNPPGSVGRIFYDYLCKGGFEVDLVARYEPKTQLEYFNFRSGQTHDLEHIMGGAGFDYLGELIPYYMRLTNLFKVLSAELAGELSTFSILGSTRILTRCVLHYPQTWLTALETVERGARVGRASDAFFMARYENVFHLTPTEARAALGIREAVDVDTKPASDIWEEKVAAVPV